MDSKIFLFIRTAAGFIYMFMGAFVLFIDNRLTQTFGKRTTTIVGIVLLAYGAFRIWRGYKMKQDANKN
jgi:putative Mn2+ efflux pump MntP